MMHKQNWISIKKIALSCLIQVLPRRKKRCNSLRNLLCIMFEFPAKTLFPIYITILTSRSVCPSVRCPFIRFLSQKISLNQKMSVVKVVTYVCFSDDKKCLQDLPLTPRDSGHPRRSPQKLVKWKNVTNKSCQVSFIVIDLIRSL